MANRQPKITLGNRPPRVRALCARSSGQAYTQLRSSPVPGWQFRPGLAVPVVERLAILVRSPELHVAPPQAIDPRVGRMDRPVRRVEEHPLRLPDVLIRQPPVVLPQQRAQIDDGVAGDSSVVVDVRIHVTEREGARGAEAVSYKNL